MITQKWLVEVNGVQFIEVPLAHARAVFSTRVGGVSGGPYATLNLSQAVGDDPQRVMENRRRFAEATGLGLNRLAAAHQVHGTQARLLSPADGGAGVEDARETVGQADILVASSQGPWPTVKVADCLPILIADQRTSAVAAAHAGWRGAAAGIAVATLQAMRRWFGTKPRDCQVALGPCIRACCYEVGEDVRHAFGANAGEQILQRSGDHWRLDLSLACRKQLEAAGVPASQILDVGLCTACRADLFFSHRRDRGRTGRMFAAVAARRV